MIPGLGAESVTSPPSSLPLIRRVNCNMYYPFLSSDKKECFPLQGILENIYFARTKRACDKRLTNFSKIIFLYLPGMLSAGVQSIACSLFPLAKSFVISFTVVRILSFSNDTLLERLSFGLSLGTKIKTNTHDSLKFHKLSIIL